MKELATWPVAVTDRLHWLHGTPLAVEPLGGMSVASVQRIRFARTSVVVKVSSSSRESLFYEHVAPTLRQAGVPVPALEWVARLDGRYWLILEDIPTPLPIPHRDVWQPDQRMVAVLARLHALALDVPTAPFARDDWQWTDAMTDAALSFFPPGQSRDLAGQLRDLQGEAGHLDEQRCWISGDPNPANWGIRGDGSLALFDWELFGRGTPPIDLAILVVGLGNPDKYERLAACYLDLWRAAGTTPSWQPDSLARDIALAKVWSVTSFLSRAVTGEGRVPEQLRIYLAEHVPPWLRMLSASLL